MGLGGRLQDLSWWSGWQEALLQLHDSASPQLQVNYNDSDQDSEGNMPGSQRGCYQMEPSSSPGTAATVNTRLTFGAFTGLLILFCVLPEKAHRLESSWPTTKRGKSARPKVTHARPIRRNVWADEPVACVEFEGPPTNRTPEIPEKPQKRRLGFFSDIMIIPW